MIDPPWIVDVADGAVLATFPDEDLAVANSRARAATRALQHPPPEGCFDAIPAARTALVLFDPLRWKHPEVHQRLLELSVAAPEPDRDEGKAHVLPVLYDGQDLSSLAHALGLTPAALIRRHTEAELRVAFTGFAPGFPYLTGLPAELHSPRHATPRPRVPAGSVAIAGRYSSVYPAELPGGWQLLGRCPLPLFFPERTPPVLLEPGDRVRFEEVGPEAFEALRRLHPPPAAADAPPSKPLARVRVPGPFSQVRGAPRFGAGRYGIPPGGAMDLAALAFANRVLGNPPLAPGLELTLKGPELELTETVQGCVVGAEAVLEGTLVPEDAPFTARAGQRLTVGSTRGVRAYLALSGGVNGPARKLCAGDLLGTPERFDPGHGLAAGYWLPTQEAIEVVRVMRAAHAERFTQAAAETFYRSEYRVSPRSDRRGLRLEGPKLEQEPPAEIESEAMARGSIQVPADGQPIILGPDGPVTGGYPTLATVISADLPRLGRLRPGARLRFREVSLDEALELRRR